MGERSEKTGFAREPMEPLRAQAEDFGKDLERHLAAELGVPSSVDLAHPSRTQERQNFETAKPPARF